MKLSLVESFLLVCCGAKICCCCCCCFVLLVLLLYSSEYLAGALMLRFQVSFTITRFSRVRLAGFFFFFIHHTIYSYTVGQLPPSTFYSTEYLGIIENSHFLQPVYHFSLLSSFFARFLLTLILDPSIPCLHHAF